MTLREEETLVMHDMLTQPSIFRKSFYRATLSSPRGDSFHELNQSSKSLSAYVIVFVLALGLLLSVPAFSVYATSSGGRGGGGETFTAHLSAAPGVKTHATGEAIFHLSPDGTQLSYKLIVANINNVFMAHIHYKDGSIIVWLWPNPNEVRAHGQTACLAVLSGGNPSKCPGYIQGRFDGVLVQGTLTAANLKPSDCAGCDGLTFSQLVSAMESGSAFVNVHTVQNPGGEIQGTIR
jgi:hypothetical protein